MPIVLTEAVPAASGRAMANAFTLIFRSAPNALLTDGIYALRSERWGPDLISIQSMIAPRHGAPGYYYQAQFS